jgi:hypothetical protein
MSTTMARAVRQLASTGRMSSLAIPVLADAADQIDKLTAERDALKEELRTIRAGEGITEPTDSPTAAVNEASNGTVTPISPLPWSASPAFNVIAANGDVVAIVSAFTQMADNTAFIVRACNSHADLRAALTRLVAHTTNGACRADAELAAAYDAALALLVWLNDAEETEATSHV